MERVCNSSKLFLVVADFNPGAKRFYIKNGFKEVGRIPDLYKNGVVESLMMKELQKKALESKKALFTRLFQLLLRYWRKCLREIVFQKHQSIRSGNPQ